MIVLKTSNRGIDGFSWSSLGRTVRKILTEEMTLKKMRRPWSCHHLGNSCPQENKLGMLKGLYVGRNEASVKALEWG